MVVAFVVVLLVKVAFVAVMVVEVRSSIVASAVEMAFDMVPMIEEAVMLPPVMVGFVMVVPSRLSMRCERATLLVRPPLAGRELGTLVSEAEREKISARQLVIKLIETIVQDRFRDAALRDRVCGERALHDALDDALHDGRACSGG